MSFLILVKHDKTYKNEISNLTRPVQKTIETIKQQTNTSHFITINSNQFKTHILISITNTTQLQTNKTIKVEFKKISFWRSYSKIRFFKPKKPLILQKIFQNQKKNLEKN